MKIFVLYLWLVCSRKAYALNKKNSVLNDNGKITRSVDKQVQKYTLMWYIFQPMAAF